MPKVDVGDTTLYYERSGRGPALLFVHGMCGDAEVWAGQAERFADRYTCVRYDRRGHTRSGRGRAPISVGQHADDAAALIESLELAPCLVVGSSAGAVITVDVALRYPQLLRGVVLSEPPLFSLDPVGGQTLLHELIPRVETASHSGGPRAAIDAFFTLICPGLWAALDDAAKDRYRANAEIGLTDLQSPALDVAPADLSTITLPALVVAGTTGHPAFGSVAHRLAAGLPNARFVEVGSSGHVTYAEQPDAFADALSVFAAELDRRPAVRP